MRIIRITHLGNAGNRMFQYMFCRMLQFRVPDSVVLGYDIPMWHLSRPCSVPAPHDRMLIGTEHIVNVEKIVDFLQGGEDRFLDFRGIVQRVEYYPSPDLMSAFFVPPADLDVPKFGLDDLVLSVRGAEILTGTHHPDYVPIPLGFYRRLIAETGKNPVFVGQIGADAYSESLYRAFPGARFIPSRGEIYDFETLRSARHLALSVSTFSWLAGWLSPTVETIHMPLLGIVNPKQRPDVNLVPANDPRYRFYLFPIHRWVADREGQEFVMSETNGGTLVSCEQIKTLSAEERLPRTVSPMPQISPLSLVIGKEPSVGGWLADLVRSGAARQSAEVAPATEVVRVAFTCCDSIDSQLAPFKKEMVGADAHKYTSSPLKIYRICNVTVLGIDQILFYNGKVIRDSLDKISTWLPGSLTEKFVPHTALSLRHEVTAVPLDEKFDYFVGCEPAWRNYALWLRHSLPRLFFFAKHFSGTPRVRLVMPKIGPDSYQMQTLALLGIDPACVVMIESGEARSLPSAFLMTPIDTWRIPPFCATAAGFLATRAMAVSGGTHHGPRIFIRRSPKDVRRIHNLPEIETVLGSFGFESVDFGRLSVVEQIKTMQAARCVVAEHGAGMANIMFCHPGTSVLELFNPTCVQPAFWTTASLAGCRFGFLVGQHAPTEGKPQPGWNSDYTIDAARLKAALIQITSGT